MLTKIKWVSLEVLASLGCGQPNAGIWHQMSVCWELSLIKWLKIFCLFLQKKKIKLQTATWFGDEQESYIMNVPMPKSNWELSLIKWLKIFCLFLQKKKIKLQTATWFGDEQESYIMNVPMPKSNSI